MVQLKILTGKKAGDSLLTRRFPVQIGRSGTSHLRLEEVGVWDKHLTIRADAREGFVLETQPDASASINGQIVERAVLRNGDIIEFGSQKIQFWLSEARQRGLRFWECLVWITLVATCAGQIALIWRVLP